MGRVRVVSEYLSRLHLWYRGHYPEQLEVGTVPKDEALKGIFGVPLARCRLTPLLVSMKILKISANKIIHPHRSSHTIALVLALAPSPRPRDSTPLPRSRRTKNAKNDQTSDAAFIPAGWDSKRLIDGLLSPDKTPWGPKATFAEVVVPPPGAVRRRVSVGGGDGGDGSAGGWTDSDSGGDGGGPAAGGEGAGRGGGGGGETVESEEAWLSSLGKQVAGTDAKARWSGAIGTVAKQVKASKVGQAREVG